jgi:hypothetical protein
VTRLSESTASAFRCCQYRFDRPSERQPVADGAVGQSCYFRPFRHAPGASVECDQTICSLIAALFFPSRPPAVVRFVAAVVVDAVDTVAPNGLLPHVGEECRERLAPAVTDCDATPAVIRILVSARVGASFDHGFPTAVRSGLSADVAVPVRSEGARLTALRDPSCQCGTQDWFHRTARAPAPPVNTAAAVSPGEFFNAPRPEGEAGEVFESRAGGKRTRDKMHDSHALTSHTGRVWSGPGRATTPGRGRFIIHSRRPGIRRRWLAARGG